MPYRVHARELPAGDASFVRAGRALRLAVLASLAGVATCAVEGVGAHFGFTSCPPAWASAIFTVVYPILGPARAVLAVIAALCVLPLAQSPQWTGAARPAAASVALALAGTALVSSYLVPGWGPSTTHVTWRLGAVLNALAEIAYLVSAYRLGRSIGGQLASWPMVFAGALVLGSTAAAMVPSRGGTEVDYYAWWSVLVMIPVVCAFGISLPLYRKLTVAAPPDAIRSARAAARVDESCANLGDRVTAHGTMLGSKLAVVVLAATLVSGRALAGQQPAGMYAVWIVLVAADGVVDIATMMAMQRWTAPGTLALVAALAIALYQVAALALVIDLPPADGLNFFFFLQVLRAALGIFAQLSFAVATWRAVGLRRDAKDVLSSLREWSIGALIASGVVALTCFAIHARAALLVVLIPTAIVGAIVVRRLARAVGDAERVVSIPRTK